MLDIVIISVPGVMRKSPQAAPALLKASVEAGGFTCKTIDFNIRFYQEFDDPGPLEVYFSTGMNTEEEPRALKLVEKWAKEIVELNPKFIGISVFTYQNRVATKLLCNSIRRLSNIKIILGGQGLSDGGILGATGFGKQMFDENLADFWIRSEGEVSLVELLKNNIEYPGINSDTFKQIDDLDSLPFPNYDDYALESYDKKSLPITGSRGCVRSCSFCDIHDHWKYRYRDGGNVANEIIESSKKYNVYDFYFTDSLVNGNLKEFKKFINVLSEYNKQTSKPIKWTSQFIVRAEKQNDDNFWQNIAESGGYELAIGVETGSDSVREHMNKKFTNEDLDYTMRMLKKFNITCVFLMIVGYPTETEEDFNKTLDMFVRYQEYAGEIITHVNIGTSLGILPGTPLHTNASEFNIELDKYENNWVALDNPKLNFDERLNRIKILKNHLLELGYKMPYDSSGHMLDVLNKQREMFNKRTQIKKLIRIKNEK